MQSHPASKALKPAAKRRRAGCWTFLALGALLGILALAEHDPIVLGPGPVGVSVGVGWRQLAVAWGSPRLSLMWWMHGNVCDWGGPAEIDRVYHWRAVAISLFWAAELCAAVATLNGLRWLRLAVISWRESRVPRGVCAGCGYDLRGLKSDAVCPECGRPQPTE